VTTSAPPAATLISVRPVVRDLATRMRLNPPEIATAMTAALLLAIAAMISAKYAGFMKNAISLVDPKPSLQPFRQQRPSTRAQHCFIVFQHVPKMTSSMDAWTRATRVKSKKPRIDLRPCKNVGMTTATEGRIVPRESVSPKQRSVSVRGMHLVKNFMHAFISAPTATRHVQPVA